MSTHMSTTYVFKVSQNPKVIKVNVMFFILSLSNMFQNKANFRLQCTVLLSDRISATVYICPVCKPTLTRLFISWKAFIQINTILTVCRYWFTIHWREVIHIVYYKQNKQHMRFNCCLLLTQIMKFINFIRNGIELK